MSHSRIALVVLFFAALLVPATPAQAASTVLCTGYTSCADKGYSHSGYSTHKGTSYWNMYTGTNCTNYAAYRLITTNGLPNKRPASGVGNARDWGTAMASVTNQTLAVGAIAWWGKTGNHVAYIERVVSADEFWVSESNWSGAFDWRKITRSGGGWPDGIIHFTAPALSPAAQPTIKGTPKVGVELTATVGTWSPTPKSFAYQWLLNGTPVSGATGKTYTPTASTAGRSITVAVTGTLPGYPTVTATSAPAVVAPGTLTSSARPVLSGTAKVGSRLSTTTGTWSRKDLGYTYRWFSGGTLVDGATGSTYVARSTDAGQTITAEVTGSRGGYSPLAARSNASAAVARGTFERSAVPTISGNARVGSRLTASRGGWTGSPTISYRWYADGRAIDGARSETFIISRSQRGTRIQVRVTASRDGFAPRSAGSRETSKVASGSIKVAVSPTVTGAPAVGSVLKVDAGQVAPREASARYQWLRDGKVVAGATGRSRKVSANDLGHRLSVRVTYKATGYSARTVTTSAGKKVRTAPRISVSASSPRTGEVAVTVKVSAPRTAPINGTLTVRDPAGTTRSVKVVKGRAAFTLTGQAPGAQTYRITLRATAGVSSGSRDKTVTVR